MSVAKVVQGRVAPGVLDAAADEVRATLIPQFMARPGARSASWMANRSDGRVLIVMVWADECAVRASRSADGEARARLAERIGLQIDTVLTMDLVAVTEMDADGETTRRWARATWVEGATPDLDLASLHRDTVSDQSRSRGFAGSYWLADREAGNGLALSFWEHPADLHASKAGSRRRRRQLERTIGCHIDRVDDYEALGAATVDPLLDLRDHLVPARRLPDDSGGHVMKAQVTHAIVDPTRIDEAAQSVRLELAPQFLDQPGARHAYWMADPSTGRLLELKVWNTAAQLEAAASIDGARRTAVAARLGFRLLTTRTMDVVGAREEEMSDEPDVRFARVTSVDGLVRDPHDRVPDLYREVVPDQARSRGFCASYWLADPSTGGGLAISLWEGAAQISASQLNSARRRSRFEQLLGCRIDSVHEFEALGVASEPVDRRAVRVPDLGHRREQLPAVADRGTSVNRPPGTLLAVAGDQARQVIVLVDGRATAVNSDSAIHLVEGAHFGASGMVHRRPHSRTVVATSPVDLLVFSRSEFASMAYDMPAVTEYLVAEDVDC